MPTAKVAMEEAQRLRRDIDNERECPDRAEQRTQGCLAQSHFFQLTSFDTVSTSMLLSEESYAE